MKRFLAINYGILLVLSSLMALTRGGLVGFYSLTPEAASFAEGLVLSHTIAMLIWPLAFLIPYYYRAMGHATFTMIIALTSMAFFRIGTAYLFINVMHRDVLWIWYAMFIDWIFRSLVFGAAFFRKKIIGKKERK